MVGDWHRDATARWATSGWRADFAWPESSWCCMLAEGSSAQLGLAGTAGWIELKQVVPRGEVSGGAVGGAWSQHC